MLLAVSELDPQWRTVYTYGGLMLKVTEAYEQSTEIFLRGAEQLPDDHFLLFSAGMNYYLYLDDPHRAYELIKEAAERPGAPGWYKGAARAFVVKTSQRKVAIRFLKEELDQTDDPELRESLVRHLASELHALRSENIEEARSAWETGTGDKLMNLQVLVESGLLASLPDDPLGGHWVIDKDGIVRSSVAAEREAAHALRYERGLLEFIE
jgi:tetratricopeptide (TPR) repeat protein